MLTTAEVLRPNREVQLANPVSEKIRQPVFPDPVVLFPGVVIDAMKTVSLSRMPVNSVRYVAEKISSVRTNLTDNSLTSKRSNKVDYLQKGRGRSPRCEHDRRIREYCYQCKTKKGGSILAIPSPLMNIQKKAA